MPSFKLPFTHSLDPIVLSLPPDVLVVKVFVAVASFCVEAMAYNKIRGAARRYAI